jgi:serine/threonine-protein kinase RsbW
MHFTYDEVEDVRLAVGEACTTAVERAINAHMTDAHLTICSEITGDALTIQVRDGIARVPQSAEPELPSDAIDEQNLGSLLMELLVDEFRVDQTSDGGTLVTMVKRAG